MIRPSSLSIAERCELAPVLAEEFPTTNANIERGNLVDLQVSRRLLGGAPATDPDALAVLAWITETLGFTGAEGFPQETIALVDPDSGEVLTEGTADYAHVKDGLVTIVDYKKREQYFAGRLADPDENMQLHAYGLAWALRYGANAYRTVILLFGDGEVQPIWSTNCYTAVPWGEGVNATPWLPYLDRIRAVQARKGERAAKGLGRPRPTEGPHCVQCYQRLHCPAWMYPAAEGGTQLAPLAKPGGITKDNAGPLLLYVLAVREAADRAQEMLKAFAMENGGQIVVGERKWKPVTMPGRKSGPSVAELEANNLGHLVRQGQPYQQWRMTKR